ncbi:MAG: hypothetical protein JST69_05855 [Bacteroidetes bacterium]|nr:hypothetical protein [Bacteroidota bacterium]
MTFGIRNYIMDEYICKNSKYEKPISVRLYDHYLETDCGDCSRTILYHDINYVQLMRQGKKYKMKISTKAEGDLLLSNYFYLSNGECEYRSRQYASLVRIFHLHIKNNETIRFFTKTGWFQPFFGNSQPYRVQSIPLNYLPT